MAWHRAEGERLMSPISLLCLRWICRGGAERRESPRGCPGRPPYSPPPGGHNCSLSLEERGRERWVGTGALPLQVLTNELGFRTYATPPYVGCEARSVTHHHPHESRVCVSPGIAIAEG